MRIVNQIRSYGENLIDLKIIENVLRSIPTKFYAIVISIEEFKDLSQLDVNELMGSLQSHEQRMNRSIQKYFEQAIQAKTNISRDRIHEVEKFSNKDS
jgi:hypothetical protein